MYYGIQNFNIEKARLVHLEMEKGDTVSQRELAKIFFLL